MKVKLPSLIGLPPTIRRRCCPGKTCGDVTLSLFVLAIPNALLTELTIQFVYLRDNGDVYRDYGAESPEKLLEIVRRDKEAS